MTATTGFDVGSFVAAARGKFSLAEILAAVEARDAEAAGFIREARGRYSEGEIVTRLATWGQSPPKAPRRPLGRLAGYQPAGARTAALESRIERERAMTAEEVDALARRHAEAVQGQAPIPPGDFYELAKGAPAKAVSVSPAVQRAAVKVKRGPEGTVFEHDPEVDRALTALRYAAARFGVDSPVFQSELHALRSLSAVQQEELRELAPRVLPGLVSSALMAYWPGASAAGTMLLRPLGVAARPVSEALIGGAVGAAARAAEPGATPAEVAKSAAVTGVLTGGISAVAPYVAPLAKKLPVIGPRLTARAEQAAKAGRVQEILDRVQVEDELLASTLVRRDVQASAKLRQAAAIQARAWADEMVARGESVTGPQLREMQASYLKEFDGFLKATKDVPAAEMMQAYDRARQAAREKLGGIMAAIRKAAGERRAVGVKVAKAETRAGVAGRRVGGLRGKVDRAAEEAARAREAAEEAAGVAGVGPTTRAEAAAGSEGLLEVLDEMAQTGRRAGRQAGRQAGRPYGARWAALSPEDRAGVLERGGYLEGEGTAAAAWRTTRPEERAEALSKGGLKPPREVKEEIGRLPLGAEPEEVEAQAFAWLDDIARHDWPELRAGEKRAFMAGAGQVEREVAPGVRESVLDVRAGVLERSLEWQSLPPEAQSAFRRAVAVPRRAAAGDVAVLRGGRVVGRTVGYDLEEAIEQGWLRRAGYAETEEGLQAFASRLYDLAGEGGGPELTFRWPSGRVRQFAESDMGFTSSEARAAARSLRGRVAAEVARGRELAAEAQAAMVRERAAGRALYGAQRELEERLRPVEEARGKAAELRGQREALGAELAGLREEAGGLRWARNPRTLKRTFPIEARETAEQAKEAAVEQLWGEAEANWHPKAVALLKDVSANVRQAEDALGLELADLGIFSRETAARWEGVHLRRIVPYYRGVSLEEMVAWLETHGPEHLPELQARMAQAQRVRGLGRSPVAIPGAIFRPREVAAAELPGHLGAERITYVGRAISGQRLAGTSAARARALRGLSEGFALTEAEFAALPVEQQARYVPMPERKGYGELAGKYLEQPIAAVLLDSTRTATVGERVVSYFKAAKVPLSVSVSVHNALCNKVMGGIEYGIGPFLPENYLAALRELADNSGLWAEVGSKYPLGAGLWTRAEIRMALQGAGGAKSVSGIFAKMNGVATGVARKASAAYGGMELLDKWACARWDMLIRGEEAAAAMARADRALINYGRVPKWVLWARRNPLGAPFLTFPYKVLTDLLPHWAQEHPGKLYALYRTPAALTATSGERDRINLEKALLPPWVAPDLMMRLPWTDKDGAGLWLDLSRLVPYADIFEASLLSVGEAAEDVRRGGVGEGLRGALEVPAALVSPFYKVGADVTAIMFAGQRPTVWGYRDLKDPGLFTKAGALTDYLARMALPGVVYDVAKVLRTKGPTTEEPWKRTRLLEAIRAAGIPIVRVKPDLEYDRAIERLDALRAKAATREEEARTEAEARYWARIGESLEKRLDLLLSMPPPPETKGLPTKEEQEQGEVGWAAALGLR